jgi:hypothetical protein
VFLSSREKKKKNLILVFGNTRKTIGGMKMARILMAMSNHPVTIIVVALFWISLSVAGAGM